MYLLIFESIGTSELILVGLVALIIFGPRKLPEMLKSFGKVMAEFKRSTNEFKESWEREVSFEDLEKSGSDKKNLLGNNAGNSIGRSSYPLENEITAPQIKEIDSDEFEGILPIEQTDNSKDLEPENLPIVKEEKKDLTEKRDWL